VRIRNIIFSFVVVSIMCATVFCMKKKQFVRQSFFEEQRGGENKEKTKGRAVYNRLLYFIKSQDEEEKKKEIISAAAANIINCSIEKVGTSTEAIAEELKLVPYIGKVVNLPGISRFTNFVFKHAASRFYNLEEAKRKKSEIKRNIEKILTERSFRIVEMECIEDNPSLWFDREIKTFTSSVEEDKKIYAEILCVAADLAKQNRGLFESVLNAAQVTDFSVKGFRVRDWFYDQLANTKDIEEKIIRSYFQEQEDEIETCMDSRENEAHGYKKSDESPIFPQEKQVIDEDSKQEDKEESDEESENDSDSEGGGCAIM